MQSKSETTTCTPISLNSCLCTDSIGKSISNKERIASILFSKQYYFITFPSNTLFIENTLYRIQQIVSHFLCLYYLI